MGKFRQMTLELWPLIEVKNCIFFVSALTFDCLNDDVNFKRLQFSQTVSRNLGTCFSIILFILEDEEFLICLLGGPSYELHNLLSENEYSDFLSISVRFISSLRL